MPAYNLELFSGRLHTDVWFALAWGAFPAVTGYVACAGSIRAEKRCWPRAGRALLSLTQRRLSTPVRRARRTAIAVTGEVALADGSAEPITRETLIAAPEAALRLLAWSTVLVAAALAVARL